MYVVTQPELEAKLIERMARPDFPVICKAYDAMLHKLGNVEGNEIIALALIAAEVPNAR